MSRIAYVQRTLPAARAARVSIEDRGYQFADGIYEVIEVNGGALIDEALHLDRLTRSLARGFDREARWRMPRSRSCCARSSRRNRVRDGMVYMQVTRGVAAEITRSPIRR